MKHNKPSHDGIRRDLTESINSGLFVKRMGNSDPLKEHPSAFIEEEHTLPNTSRRIDIAVKTPNRKFAFEIKVTYQDYLRFSEQVRDYRQAGWAPVLVAPKPVYAEFESSEAPQSDYHVLYDNIPQFIEIYPVELSRLLEKDWSLTSAPEISHKLSSCQFRRTARTL